MPRTLRPIVAAVLAALVWPAVAGARGGHYVFDGGSARQRAQVRIALDASSFDWSIVPARIVIHLRKSDDTYAVRGEIFIDADLLDSGIFAWGPIQHEYAHQVDFFLLNGAKRATLLHLLGGRSWFAAGNAVAGFKSKYQHALYGCERFASTLAWSYWMSSDNSLRPQTSHDESAAMEPARFRKLLEQMLGVRNPAPPVVTAK
jgi:hypothetical protein